MDVCRFILCGYIPGEKMFTGKWRWAYYLLDDHIADYQLLPTVTKTKIILQFVKIWLFIRSGITSEGTIMY